jgi:hypothetical protein
LEEEIEPLEHETEGYERDGRPHPGEKSALIGRVIGETLDHWALRWLHWKFLARKVTYREHNRLPS